jgi:hypothetical protein
MKQYTVIKHRRGRESEVTGTIEEITKYFSYTLECGNSWNRKINRFPKTIKSLVKNINDSYHETQGSCYNQDYVTLKEVDA